MNIPPAKLSGFLGELQKNVRGDLRTDEYSRILYSTDASIYQVKPYGVLIPKRSKTSRPPLNWRRSIK